MTGLAVNFQDEISKAEKATERMATTVEKHGVSAGVKVERMFGAIKREFQRFFFDLANRLPIDKIVGLVQSIDTTAILDRIDAAINEVQQFFQNPMESLGDLWAWIMEMMEKAAQVLVDGLKVAGSWLMDMAGKAGAIFAESVKGSALESIGIGGGGEGKGNLIDAMSNPANTIITPVGPVPIGDGVKLLRNLLSSNQAAENHLRQIAQNKGPQFA